MKFFLIAGHILFIKWITTQSENILGDLNTEKLTEETFRKKLKN